VNFHFLPEFFSVGGPTAMPDSPDIYTALREQLGLQLQKGKGPVDYLVIEHVERPSAN
jgi:uncharacterized protein (TIGR03435 family)